MTTPAVRCLVRLTLFSGPNCSLCDVAKAQLAEARKTRSFDLDVVNIQGPGQERWKRKYVYWIPALHVEGIEVAKGRWDSDTVTRILDEWERNSPSIEEKHGSVD